MNASQSFPTILAAALEYAARGWPVFPVPPGAKKSHKSAEHSGGRNWGATTDPDEIRRDWSRWPDANVGIVTGAASGFFVIEADTAAGHDVDGIGNLAALIEANGPLPATIEAMSPSGSWHIYFRWPEGREVRNSAGMIAPGVDVRGEGGMVVAVPSAKPGAALPYRWKNPPPLFDLADCPDWLLDLATKPKAPPAGPRIDTGIGGTAWAEAALRGELARVLAAPAGKRNATLNAAAFSLGQIVGGGGLGETDVAARLTGAALAAGLDVEETARTIASGMGAGKQTPRGPADDLRSDFGKDEASDHDAAGKTAPNSQEGFDLSHDQLALDLGKARFDRDWRHVAAWGAWLIWSGSHWRKDGALETFTAGRDFLRHKAEEVTTWAEARAANLDDKEADKLRSWAKGEARTLRHKQTVAAVIELARSNKATAAAPDAFDRDPYLLGTPGGSVDLRTGKTRPARRDDMLTKLTGCTPENGKPAEWLRFLDTIFAGDGEMIAFLRRALGYSLTGETREHKLLFAYGTGANGKSTFLNAAMSIWGDYGRRAAATTFLNKHVEGHPTDVAGLAGARLVVASELPRGASWNEAIIKDLTGGDRMTARFMRGDFFDFDPMLKLWIAGNTMPSFRGVDEAMRRRVVLIPFAVTISPEERDPTLPAKLEAERGRILSWMIDGALEWQAGGLRVPATVAAASDTYLDDEDTLGLFLDDETERDPSAFTTTGDLHMRFGQWCDTQGLNRWTMHILRKELISRGFQDARRMHGRGFIGIRLKRT